MNNLNKKGQIIGYTTGIFDLFHIGHLNLLKNARSKCDKLIVGVATDELCKILKNRNTIIPFEERIEIVKSIIYVDLALPEDTDDKFNAWCQLKFDVIFKGDDWKGTQKWETYEKLFRDVGVEIIYFPYTKEISTTILTKALEKLNG